MLLGDPTNPPTLKVPSGYSGSFVIYGKDPDQDKAECNFYIAVKNIIIDTTAVDKDQALNLLDWSIAQATQLTNVVFNMPDYSSGHVGIAAPEQGSSTFMGDLTFNGGSVGIQLANQQFEFKSMSFNRCHTGIQIYESFDLVVIDAKFVDCTVGLDMTNGGSMGSVVLLDSSASNTGTVVSTNAESNGDHALIIENLSVDNVGVVVAAAGTPILTDGVDSQSTWVYGNAYTPNGPSSGSHQTGTIYSTPRTSTLAPNGAYPVIPPPTYQEFDVSQFINVKSVDSLPVYGDGNTDDTENLIAIISQYAGCKILFFPAGTYIVSDTLHFPPGSQVIGEAWSAISAIGPNFAGDPRPMIQIGNPGDVGVAQFSNMIFTVADILPGAILAEVNMAGKSPGDVGFWNTHFRVGGAAGSKVLSKCQGDPGSCMAAFVLLHLGAKSSAYFEDMWAW